MRSKPHLLQYPILESAITGRINMADGANLDGSSVIGRPSSLLDTRHMDDKEVAKLRNAMMEREGLIVSIFELLRTVPRYVGSRALRNSLLIDHRRLLMILKLSDLQRYEP